MNLAWPIPAAVGGITLLTMGDVAAFMSAFCPSIFTVRTFRSDEQKAGSTATDIYIGMAIAGTLAVMVAFGAGMASDSYWPIVGAVATQGAIVAAYTWALQNPHADAKPMNQQAAAGGSSFGGIFG